MSPGQGGRLAKSAGVLADFRRQAAAAGDESAPSVADLSGWALRLAVELETALAPAVLIGNSDLTPDHVRAVLDALADAARCGSEHAASPPLARVARYEELAAQLGGAW